MSGPGEFRFEKIRSVKRMKEIMTAYYIDAKTAKQNGKKVAWLTSGAPVEPVITMDMVPIYPENHSAMIGASKQGNHFCQVAEDEGFSTDICSYARSDIGCSREGGGPVGGLPEPDILICCTNICNTVLKWYEVQAKYYQVPLFILDTPIVHQEYHDENRRYVMAQLQELFTLLEEVGGKPFDMDAFYEVVHLSLEGQRRWQSVLDTSMNRPAPMSAFDAFFHLALIVTLRGTQTAVDYYGELLDEMNGRLKEGICAVPNEKYRLLWDNLPVWYRTRWLSDTFASRDACLVADTYTTAWCENIRYVDTSRLMESYAELYTRIYLNIGVDQMIESVKGMADKYQVDGVVLHSNRSCKPYSLGQYDIRRALEEEMGIPSLVLEADMVDERFFNESAARDSIDTFMDMVAARS
jgi:bcr-type benzoyl-CoA reductase subunit B